MDGISRRKFIQIGAATAGVAAVGSGLATRWWGLDGNPVEDPGTEGTAGHLPWVRDVFPEIKAHMPDVTRIFYYDLFETKAGVLERSHLDQVKDFLLDIGKLIALAFRRQEIHQRMFADHRGLCIANRSFDDLLRLQDRFGISGKPREKRGRVGDLPADEHRRQQVEAVLCQALGELVFREVLNPLVEFVLLLNGPGPLKVGARVGYGPRRLAERGNHGDLGLSELEHAHQQADDNQQQDADR